MARQNNREELLGAWRALVNQSGGEGWRTIHIALGGPCRVLAGRYLPGDEEALLLRFALTRISPDLQLPGGGGFLVSRVAAGPEGDPGEWLALRRQRGGNLELFTLMSLDLITTISELAPSDDGKILPVFLARIRAWQEFMRRPGDGVLSEQAEVGLYGELELFGRLLEAGVPADRCINAWEGPLDGIQDFRLGGGAIEVKTSIAQQGFEAWIGSLEQLDDSLVQPLFLAGVRLSVATSGRTLPERISDLRDALNDDPAAREQFNTQLLRVGYFEHFAGCYGRRFLCTGLHVHSVDGAFPRLTRGSVPIGVRSARYEIDLDQVAGRCVDLTTALRQLKVN